MRLEDAMEFNPTEKLSKGTMAKKVGMEKLFPFYKFVLGYDYEKYSGGSKFRNGDTIVARITPCLENGKTAYIDFLNSNEIAFGSTEFIVMRSKENITIPEYVYYLSISPRFRDKAISLMTGTSGRQRVQVEPLKYEEFTIPSILEQKKVVQILSAIDKKIKINNKINNNLHKLMENQFFEWIENLTEYEESNLTSIATYTNGLAMQKFRPKNEKGLPVVKIKEMNNGISSETERCTSNIKEDVKVYDGDILFAWSGTLCASVWCNGDAGLNQHIFKVTSNKYPKWFYYFWTLKHLNKFKMIAEGKTTTMGHIQRKELDNSEVKIPSQIELNKMDKIMGPLLEKFIINNIETRNLSQLRDTLLPKLMNGEIDLDNIEI